MGVVFRQSVKTTLVTFTGALLGMIVNFSYAYAFARYANGKQLNGALRNIFVQGNMLQLFFIFGTAGILFTYVNRFRKPQQQKLLLSFAALVPVAVFGLFLIPYCLFREPIIHLNKPEDQPFIRTYYFLMPVLALLWAFITQIETFLIAQNKAALSAFPREVLLKLVTLALIVLFYYQLIPLTAFITGSILVYILPTILLLPVARRTGQFGFSADWHAFTRAEYRELAHFGWYHLLGGLTFVLLGQIDTYMLGIYSSRGLIAVAEYFYPVLIVTIMTIPYKAIINAAWPTLNEAYSNGKMPLLNDLFRRSATNIHIAAVAMAVLIACNLDNVIPLLPKGYERLKPLALIMMIGRLIDMATGLNTEVISISEYYKFNFRVSVVLLVLLVLFNMLLIPRYDVFGAAWSTTFSLAIFNICKMWFLRTKMGIQPFSRSTPKIVLCGVVAAIAGLLLPRIGHVVADTAVRSLLIAGVYIAMLLWLKPSEDLSTFISNMRRNKRLF